MCVSVCRSLLTWPRACVRAFVCVTIYMDEESAVLLVAIYIPRDKFSPNHQSFTVITSHVFSLDVKS